MIEDFIDIGIEPKGTAKQQKLKCPKCSHTRKNKQDIKPTLFDMPSSLMPPRPKVRKTRTPKIEIQVNDKPKSELGVIRRFLKWLW